MSAMDDKSLQAALEVVRTDREEAKKFTADPEAYLQARGVDTAELRFGETSSEELSDADLELAAGGARTVCTSVGAGEGVMVCTSVGDEQIAM